MHFKALKFTWTCVCCKAPTGWIPTRALLWTPSKSSATWRLERPASARLRTPSPWRTGTRARTSERRSTSGSESPCPTASRYIKSLYRERRSEKNQKIDLFSWEFIKYITLFKIYLTFKIIFKMHVYVQI